MPRSSATSSHAVFVSVSICILLSFATVRAGTFLDRQALPPVQNLLEEVQKSIGSGRFQLEEDRIQALEDAMRPIFKSLPRTAEGLLPPSAVRYLLHRVFVDRHTWFVRGIENTGAGWNTSSPSIVFVEHGGQETDDVFERRLNKGGFTLHETAVFGATFESMVRAEFVERLNVAYNVTADGIAKEGSKESEVEQVIDTFMLMYVLAVNHTKVTAAAMPKLWERCNKYPHWDATKGWARDVRREVVSTVAQSRTAYKTTVQVVFEMMDRYGRWQNHECDAMKNDLMEIEWNHTGRVRLQDFYRAALTGKWLFSEAKEYLRELGALDESNAAQPSVLIANYINAPSNCLAESKFYSVCCVNECEALLSPIERHIAAPDALPVEIVRIVEELPSATVDAPRKLPPVLVERLDEIASHHGGRIPIHGRLFAQWMHHAYPRECPFPHLAGAVAPMRGKEWEKKTGIKYLANKTVMTQYVEDLAESDDVDVGAVEAAIPWSVHEELFAHHLPTEVVGGRSRNFFRGLVMIAAASSFTVAIFQTAMAGKSIPKNGFYMPPKDDKHLV